MDKGDMILVLKNLHGFLEGVQWQDFFQMAYTSRLRRHPLNLRKDRSRLDLRKYTFSQRVVNTWNNLPAEVFTASSVKMFKNKLEAHLKSLQRIARVTATERTVLAYALMFLLVFLLTSVKNRLLNRVQGYVPLPFILIYIPYKLLYSTIDSTQTLTAARNFEVQVFMNNYYSFNRYLK